MISFNVETGATISEVVRELAHTNYEESGILQKVLPLDVKESAYTNSRIFTMRDVDDVLVGYSIYFFGEAPHFSGVLFAFNDVIYIKPEYRKEYAVDFFKFCEANMDEGVQVIQHGMNYAQPHSHLMESLGYFPAEIMYCKVIA